MASTAQPIIPSTRPRREFYDHENAINAVARFPDGRRIVTSSHDKTLRLWDLDGGKMLKTMKGHRGVVAIVAVSSDGKLIASGDFDGELIIWDGDSGESLNQPIKAHSDAFEWLDFSPDSTELATVSRDKSMTLWRTDTWETQGNPIYVGENMLCVRYSPSGELLATAAPKYIRIWNRNTSKWIAKFRALDAPGAWNCSLAWAPDGTRLFSGRSSPDPTIREWDTSTWDQVGDPWSGHTGPIFVIAVNSTGTLIASASEDTNVRLWRLSDRQTIAMFKHSHPVFSVTFSADDKYILSGGHDAILSEWEVPTDALLEGAPKGQVSDETFPNIALEEQGTENTQDLRSKILSISTSVRDACVTMDLSTAQELLTQEVDIDGDNHNAYANRSFVLARKCDWDGALHDALRSISIQPSLIGHISKGIALCGKMEFKEAMKTFDLAFMFTDQDSNIVHCLLLIKAIAMFNANQQEEAMQRIQDLVAICPNADTLACRVVEAYLRVQQGANALNDARHTEAANHFTAAINTGFISSKQAIHSKYEIFVILFGWDLASLWETANQKRCYALLQASRLTEAHEAYRYLMDASSEATKASCVDWSNAFQQECRNLYAMKGVTNLIAGGDDALTESDYDKSIELYSAEINLDGATDTILAKRCKAKMGKRLWEEALIDAQEVINVNPSSYLGYSLKHEAHRGAQQYDEAIEAIEIMLTKLDDGHDPEIQALRRHYISRSDADGAIRKVIDTQMENTPPRLFDTFTGRLCDRDAVINSFKMRKDYTELLSSTMTYSDLRSERIQNVVSVFFQYVMFSHRWEGKEPLLHDIQGKNVYQLNPVNGVGKLQSFCEVARDRGYRWAWSDTCCIDKNNNIDLQESVNSMFIWYRHSALTIIYLSDVLPSSKSGALARSVWNSRGWTVQEFLAPRIVLFYQRDWTLYLDDQSPNHKESAAIMQELADATGISPQALVAFRPEMRDAREKLQWSSKRVTTLQEDIAYSLFGTFGVHLSPIYGEKKQNALGRLLQEIVAQSGDISCLDWVGISSQFNSCLPASITVYADPPFILPSLSEDEMQASVFLLRDARESASRLHDILDQLTAPRFAHRRLHLPCIVFTVSQIAPRLSYEDGTKVTYAVEANDLHDLLITTEDTLIPFSRSMPNRQKLLVIRPWDRNLLELPDFAEPFDVADDVQSNETEDYRTPPSSPPPFCESRDAGPGENMLVDSESDLRALRLLVRLRRPFRAFLLAQQWGGEYKRIAADYDIIAQVKDVRDMMDIRTLEIL